METNPKHDDRIRIFRSPSANNESCPKQNTPVSIIVGIRFRIHEGFGISSVEKVT